MTDGVVLWPVGLAVLGLTGGLLHRLPVIGRWDGALALRLNQAPWPASMDRCLGAIRMVGTTPFFLVSLVVVALLRPSEAVSLAVAAALAEGLCKALKFSVRRQRPFEENRRVVLRLARKPIDSSFPSADAMRAAFLCGLTSAANPPWWVVLAMVCLALAVAMGRVRSGAHYPLDTWAGLLMGFGVALAWPGMSGGGLGGGVG